MKTLAKINTDKMIGGVSAGIAYAVGVPTWMTRVAFVLALCLPGSFILYLLLWVFMPKWEKDPEDYFARTNRMYEDEKPGSAA